MFCSECGHKNKEGATFCTECGKTLKKKEPQKEQVQIPEEKKPLKRKSVRSAVPAVEEKDTVHETIYEEEARLTKPQKEEIPSIPAGKFRVFGVIGETFRLWGANLGKLVLMTLLSHTWLAGAFVLALGIDLHTQPNRNLNPVTNFIFGSVCFIGLSVSYSACFAGMILIFDEYHKKGERLLGALEAFQKGFGYVLKVVGLLLLVMLCTYVFFIPDLMLISQNKKLNEEIVGWLFLIALAPFFFLVIRWILTIPAAIIENRRLGALARSAELVRGKYWRIISACIIMGLIICFLIGFITALNSLMPLMVISIIAAGLLVPPLMVSFYYAMYAEALRSQVESSKDNAGDMSKYKPGAGLRIITGFQSVGGILLSILSAMLVSTENTTVTAMWVLIGFAVCLLGFGIYYVKKWSWVASIVVSLVSVFFVIVFILEASGSSSNQQTFFKIALGFFILLFAALVLKKKDFLQTV